MNIVLATHRYPTPDRPELISDVEALHIFARQWVADGHAVTVVHLYQHENRDELVGKPSLYDWWIKFVQMDGVNVLRIECRHIRRLPALSRAYFARIAQKVSGSLGSPDILLVHFPTALDGFADNLQVDCPRVAVLHTTDIGKLKSRGPKLMDRLRAAYSGLGYRSPAIREAFHQLSGWDKPEFMVYSGAPEMAAPTNGRERGDTFKVIYVGKLIERKRPEMLIGAMCELPVDIDWRLTIVGDGPMYEKLLDMAYNSDARERIRLTGRKERDEVLALMAEHDAFVMVSTGETFGLVYLEAMSQGLVTIGTRGEGIDGMIVDGENGFLAPYGDSGALKELLIKIARMSTGEYGRLSRAAIATANSMTESEAARTYLKTALEAGKK